MPNCSGCQLCEDFTPILYAALREFAAQKNIERAKAHDADKAFAKRFLSAAIEFEAREKVGAL